jgi:hypothetical protein
MYNNQNKAKQVLEVPKYIILWGKLLQFFSVNLAAKFAQNLFITPIKFKPPKREREMFFKSLRSKITITSIHKDIVVYQYGNNKKADKKSASYSRLEWQRNAIGIYC